MPYRVLGALGLSEAERSELEGWARRRKTAQALALRARIVLRAADGLSNTAIAAELATSQHTVGKWRERFARLRADGLLDGWRRRLQPPRRAAADRRRAGRRAGGPDALDPPGECQPLEPANHGAGHRLVGHDGGARLARLRPAAAPGGDLQALDRPLLRREGPRHRRALRCPTRPRSGALRGRESQVQALDRTQPLLPLRPGQAERRTHDYAWSSRSITGTR